MENENIKKIVRENYAEVAKKGGESSCCGSSCCCGSSYAEDTAKGIGYSSEELASVPEGSNLGLGCGNPHTFASLKEGEIVVDLGSGAGFDCFLASNRIGEKGIVIGVDMTPDMIDRARNNAKKGRYRNVEFRLGEIENLPVRDNYADAVISNCVINLSTDKQRVFNEAFRVLKKGGRISLSDVVLLKELPEEIKKSKKAYTGCLSGAILKNEYISAIKTAGFSEVIVESEDIFPLDFMLNDNSAQNLSRDIEINPKIIYEVSKSVASIKIKAVK